MLQDFFEYSNNKIPSEIKKQETTNQDDKPNNNDKGKEKETKNYCHKPNRSESHESTSNQREPVAVWIDFIQSMISNYQNIVQESNSGAKSVGIKISTDSQTHDKETDLQGNTQQPTVNKSSQNDSMSMIEKLKQSEFDKVLEESSTSKQPENLKETKVTTPKDKVGNENDGDGLTKEWEMTD
jgi:hypothetical protein